MSSARRVTRCPPGPPPSSYDAAPRGYPFRALASPTAWDDLSFGPSSSIECAPGCARVTTRISADFGAHYEDGEEGNDE